MKSKHPVQHLLAFITSLTVHAAILLLALVFAKIVLEQVVPTRLPQEQTFIPVMTISDDAADRGHHQSGAR